MIIIGTGAGGGTLAYSLAKTGKRILMIERGNWVPREKENWDTREVFINERYHATEMWYDGNKKPFRPHTSYNVGGNTKFYGSILFRFRERDFLQVQHHDGVSPEWPIRYQDLAAYYTLAERLYAVHGMRGEDPTEPRSADPYPWPAMSHEPRMQEVDEGLPSSSSVNPALTIMANALRVGEHLKQRIGAHTPSIRATAERNLLQPVAS